MSLDIDRDTTQPRRPIWAGVIGILMLIFAAIVYWIGIQDRTPEIDVPTSYQYTINQSVDTSVKYMNSSFFDGGPGTKNTAYITELTDALRSHFHYNFSGSSETDLQYTYSVNATVQALYTLKEESKAQPTVWSKEFELVEPTTVNDTIKSFTLDPTVDVPFAEYKKLIDQLNTALDLSMTSEVVITSTVTVSGEIDGVDFKDTRVASVTAPLTQQLYDLAVKYDKQDTGQVAAATGNKWTLAGHYIEIAAGAIALAGLLLLVYGFRSQIFKTPYQRELDRIFRYHDGIIIRASKPAKLQGKNVVSVQSFDDILNLEEEMKTPIIAAPAGAEATNFIIHRDDIAYVYTLGKPLLEQESIDDVDLSTMTESEETKPASHHNTAKHRKKVQ